MSVTNAPWRDEVESVHRVIVSGWLPCFPPSFRPVESRLRRFHGGLKIKTVHHSDPAKDVRRVSPIRQRGSVARIGPRLDVGR